MNACMFFEGTGQGVAGKITNVTRLRDLCVDDARQKLHLVADLALAWIAAGARREGLRLGRGVRLSQKIDTSAVVLHDSHGEPSNLWGAFGRVRRNLPRIRLHFVCKGL